MRFSPLSATLILPDECSVVSRTHSSNTSWVVNGSHPGDSLPYIPTLSGLVAVYVVSMYAQSILLAYLIVTASRRLYVAMFDRVLRAPMAFFERNPVGRFTFQRGHFYHYSNPIDIREIKLNFYGILYRFYTFT